MQIRVTVITFFIFFLACVKNLKKCDIIDTIILMF